MSIAFVTGTSTGIGQATALRLARDGHRVVATMRNPDAGAPLVEAREAEGLSLDVVALDVNDAEACERVVADSGPIDVLVNNAGIGGLTAVEDASDDEWLEMLSTNVIAPMRLCRLVLPGMRERGAGTIVNVTSVAGRLPIAPQALYAASKHALEGASEALAQEVAPFGIRVVIIEPGVILTPIFFKGDDSGRAESPYAAAYERASRMFTSLLADPSPPELVADTISESISTTEPVLRYPVGPDAHKLFAGRAAISDQEYVDLGRVASDDEFAERFKDLFDLEI